MKLYYVVKPVELEGSRECRYYPMYITYHIDKAVKYFNLYSDESLQYIICSKEINKDTNNIYFIEDFGEDGYPNESVNDTFYGLWDYVCNELDEDDYENNYISYDKSKMDGPIVIDLNKVRKWKESLD